jgi:ribonuclease HII
MINIQASDNCDSKRAILKMDLSKIPLLHAGVDEVGRGPLAGPVIAAAVILNPVKKIDGLTDSKLLTPKKREALSELIKSHALAWSIGRAEVGEIDTINIFHASLLAMKRAIDGLSLNPDIVLVDGKHCPKINFPSKAIVKGDLLVPAISAASIIAKVFRDAEMADYDDKFPGYDFARHKGYCTLRHRLLLKQQGISPIHRRTFLIKQRDLFDG